MRTLLLSILMVFFVVAGCYASDSEQPLEQSVQPLVGQSQTESTNTTVQSVNPQVVTSQINTAPNAVVLPKNPNSVTSGSSVTFATQENDGHEISKLSDEDNQLLSKVDNRFSEYNRIVQQDKEEEAAKAKEEAAKQQAINDALKQKSNKKISNKIDTIDIEEAKKRLDALTKQNCDTNDDSSTDACASTPAFKYNFNMFDKSYDKLDDSSDNKNDPKLDDGYPIERVSTVGLLDGEQQKFKNCLVMKKYGGGTWQTYCQPIQKPKNCKQENWRALETLAIMYC